MYDWSMTNLSLWLLLPYELILVVSKSTTTVVHVAALIIKLHRVLFKALFVYSHYTWIG